MTRVSGKLLSGSLMDYCLPRADHLPMMTSRPTRRFARTRRWA
jgi:hypothetical protein